MLAATADTDVFDSIFKQPPRAAAAFLVQALKSRDFTVDELEMFLAEGWPEAAPELQLDRFVLEVLKELNNLVAPPILSKKFVRSLLTASKEV
mmetsp:Transcript_26003/g.46043  ORF Transcript_26003/g.46043 Transcript_26003/m.46043 type:complete len:93 (+) Transcript_26003:2115-2393(+)